MCFHSIVKEINNVHEDKPLDVIVKYPPHKQATSSPSPRLSHLPLLTEFLKFSSNFDTMAMNTLIQGFYEIPIVTRIYTTACVW